MDSQNYSDLIKDVASFYYDTVGVEWHKGKDVVDMGDDGDGYDAYEIDTIELEGVQRIFRDGEHQSNFEDELRNIIKEVENED